MFWMKLLTLLSLLFSTVEGLFAANHDSTHFAYSNVIDEDRMLIVLAAPTVDNDYYHDVYRQILNFQIDYARAIMGHDNVIIVADEQAYAYLVSQLPADILLPGAMADIWMRDFTTTLPHRPLRFRYTAAAQEGDQFAADEVQAGFEAWANEHQIQFRNTRLQLDGGNLVDNYAGRVIVSEKFLHDNQLSYTLAKKRLREVTGAEQVAIIPSDDPKGLAHADGMIMFLDENTIGLNHYPKAIFGNLQSDIISELKAAFPDVNIIPIAADFAQDEWDPRYGSACGLYVNATVTHRAIYVPTFGTAGDEQALNTIRQHTDKTVIAVPAGPVCMMGGSVRCLSWQLAGKPAEQLIKAAR